MHGNAAYGWFALQRGRQGQPLHRVAIELRVTFFGQSELGDLDNLLKPIQDALQGIAYYDDRQIVEVTSRRRNINSTVKVRYMSSSVAMALSDGRQLVHIEFWADPDQETIG